MQLGVLVMKSTFQNRCRQNELGESDAINKPLLLLELLQHQRKGFVFDPLCSNKTAQAYVNHDNCIRQYYLLKCDINSFEKSHL